MSDIINSNKLTSLIIGNTEDEILISNTARAFASRDRIKILRLLVNAPLNIYEISKRLNMPISTVSNHISILEEAQIIFVSMQQGVKKHVKMCSKQVNEISFKLYSKTEPKSVNPFTTELSVGQFTEANISPPCGLYVIDKEHEQEGMISTDTPLIFSLLNALMPNCFGSITVLLAIISLINSIKKTFLKWNFPSSFAVKPSIIEWIGPLIFLSRLMILRR